MPPDYRLTFRLPAAAEDRLVAELWAAGTTGIELRAYGERPEGEARDDAAPVEALAYFADADPELWRRRGQALAVAAGARLVATEAVEPADWLAEYRRQARPIAVGRRLLVDPSGSDHPPAVPAGVELLRIPAETAFGTGSHESTRLAVTLLERRSLAGQAVVDVGTGSGILAFAARRFGAARVVAFDADPAALPVAARNARRNRCAVEFFAGRLAALGPFARFDLALVNILPERIGDELDALGAILAPGSVALFSGITREVERRVADHLRATGFDLSDRIAEGEWVALEAVWRGPMTAETE